MTPENHFCGGLHKTMHAGKRKKKKKNPQKQNQYLIFNNISISLLWLKIPNFYKFPLHEDI